MKSPTAFAQGTGSKIRLLTRLSIANVRRHRPRVLLIVVGIVLGVASITAVLALSRSVVDTFATSVLRGAGAAQLQVSNGTAGLDRELVYAIARLPGVTATGATVQHHVVISALGRRVTVFGVELGRDEAYREVQTGRDVADIPDAGTFIAQPDSIALSSTLLDAGKWARGDAVDVIGAKGRRTLKIRGTVHPHGILQAFGGDVALMDLDAAQLQFGAADRVHWIDVVIAPTADVATVQGLIVDMLDGRGTVESPVARGRRIDTMLSLLRTLLTGTSVVAMLVGIFLIHHTLATSYRQRRPDFARLRMLGLSRWWLVGHLIVEAVILGLAASILGVIAGIGFWMLATRDFASTISTLFIPIPIPRFNLSVGECGGAVAFGTLAVVVGAVGPLIATLRLRPLETKDAAFPSTRLSVTWTMVGLGLLAASGLVAHSASGLGFGGQVTVIGAMAACIFVGSTLLVPSLLLASRPLLQLIPPGTWPVLGRWTWLQVWRRRLHTATTMGALAAGVAFALGLTFLLGSYRAAFRSWFDQTLAGDVVVNAGPTISLLGGETLDGALADTVANVEGVDHVLRWRFLQVQFRGAPIVLQAISEDLLARTYPSFHGEGDAILISDTLAERFGLDVGDAFTISAPIAPLTLHVGGIVPDYVLHLGTVKLPWQMFVRHFGDESVSLLFVSAKQSTPPSELKRQIENVLRDRYDVSVLTAAEVHALVEGLVDQSVVLTYWLQVLAALVAVAAIVNAMSASIIDRERELRSWRALGLRRRRLVCLLVYEAAAIGIGGSALGLLGGTLLGWSLTTSIARAVAGFRLTVYWPVGTMIGLPVVSTLAAALAAAAVALRWTRGRPLTGAPSTPL